MTVPFFYFDPSINYPREAPFSPSERYEEYPFADSLSSKNEIYAAIRDLFKNVGLDKENFGTSKWNPLGEYIKPGNTVLLKPNLVNDKNPAEDDYIRGLDCLITHPSIVRCIFDYVYIALNGEGKIIIADAPIQDCLFKDLLQKTGYEKLFNYVENLSNSTILVQTGDLRGTVKIKENNTIVQKANDSVLAEGILVDLGRNSYFSETRNKKGLRVTNYWGGDTASHHTELKNEYLISKAILDSDVIISIPKPKTHRIAGYTAALKNTIGMNTKKEYLPHHQSGFCGDEFTGKHLFVKRCNSFVNDVRTYALKENIHWLYHISNELGRKTGRYLDSREKNRYKFGMWYGNDTIWRTILDVNHAVMYANSIGAICSELQRKIIYFGDMIVCGEAEGPLRPSYKKVGGILFAEDAVLFDRIVVKLMGYDYTKFPVLTKAEKDELLKTKDFDKLLVSSNEPCFSGNILDINRTFEFVPSSGWAEYL